MDDLNVARNLRAAAGLLRTQGKSIGTYWDGGEGGPHCTIGALVRVCGSSLEVAIFSPRGRDVIECHTRAIGFDFIESVYGWSDTNSLETVLDRLESAALNLEIRALAASGEKNAPTREAEPALRA